MELDTYYICLLCKGPNWTAEQSPELEALHARHLANKRALVESGAALANGPVDDESDIRGITLFRTATLEEAQALAADDPGVRSGRFVLEFHTWFVPKGSLAAPATEPLR